jgi:DNA-binding transcriptional LysR family regulator
MLREVAQHGGVTAAAEAMHYSASGISQQLSALEDELGVPVLERRGRGVRLTKVGEVLLEHATVLLDAEREARAAVERARDSLDVELKVGVFCTVAAGHIPAIVEDLATEHPLVRVVTRETDPDDAALALRHGHLDLAFLLEYPDAPEPWIAGVTLVPLGRDRIHLAAPAGWFDPGTVDLTALGDRPWVMPGEDSYYGRAMRTACRRAGFEPRVVHEVGEQPTALAMVAAGLGVTLMSQLGRPFVPGSGVDVLPLDQDMHRELLLGHDRSTHSRPAVAAFLASARRTAPAAGLARPRAVAGRQAGRR